MSRVPSNDKHILEMVKVQTLSNTLYNVHSNEEVDCGISIHFAVNEQDAHCCGVARVVECRFDIVHLSSQRSRELSSQRSRVRFPVFPTFRIV